jgi:hypothetical protein
MKKVLCVAMVLASLLYMTSAGAATLTANMTKEPTDPETDSVFEMLDAVYDGAVAAALVSDKSGVRYVFITGADERCLYVFDPSVPGIQRVELWQAEKWVFEKFYVYYPDSPFDELAMN